MNIVNKDHSRANYSNPFLDRALSYFLDRLSTDRWYLKGWKHEWCLYRWSTTGKDILGAYFCVHYVIKFKNKYKRNFRVDLSIRL